MRGPSPNLAWSDRVTIETALADISGNGKGPFCKVVFAEPPSPSISIRCTPCPHSLLDKTNSISPMPSGRKVDGIFIGQCIFFRMKDQWPVRGLRFIVNNFAEQWVGARGDSLRGAEFTASLDQRS